MPRIPARAVVAAATAALCLNGRPASAGPIELALQGGLTSSGGGPVADGAYPMGIAFYADKQGGAPLWTELFLGVPVKGGAFAIALGAGITKLDSALFTGKPLFVGVTVGTDPELTREPLRRVPQAIHASVAALAHDVACTGCVGADDLAKAAVTGDKIATGAVGANHVSFNWAGSDSPGGAATFAVGANQAKLAESAKVADSASFAEEAGNAKIANLAKALQCTGCVSLAMLGKDASDGFLSTKGGTVAGAVTVSAAVTVVGDLDVAKSIQWGAVDLKDATCGVAQAGRVTFDKVSQRLYLCDGAKQRRITVCSELCQPPGGVPCGQLVTDGCGDQSAACGTGSQCAAGQTCENGKCIAAGSQASPVLSCKALATAVPGAKSGAYWLDPDGAGAGAPFQTWCDMETAGGGWTLVSIISSSDGIASMSCGLNWDYKSALWTDVKVLTPDDFDEKKDHKYASYASVGFTDFLMVEKVAGKVGYKQWKMPSAQTSFSALMGGGCTTLADAPVTSGGAISADNALIFSNNLKRNCNSDYANNDDMSRLHGNSPNNPQGNCYNGGWGLGVDGDHPNCEWASEARPQYGGWTTQCYSETGFYSGGEMCNAGCAKHHDAGTFVGSLYVR